MIRWNAAVGKIKYKGWFRDPIRSTLTQVSKSLGIRWLCLAVLVPVPWSQRLWALPFMTVPALGPKTSTKLQKRHRTLIDWAMLMADKVRRWQPDAELRAHPGFETQRQWSDKAIERTTHCLSGLFSLVVLMAKVLHPASLPVRQTCWYVKGEATFIDALAAVRGDLWRHLNCSTSSQNPNVLLIPRKALFSLLHVACYST